MKAFKNDTWNIWVSKEGDYFRLYWENVDGRKHRGFHSRNENRTLGLFEQLVRNAKGEK